MSLTQRIFVDDNDGQLIIDTVSEELNIRIFVDSDEGGCNIIIIDDDGEEPGEDSLVVVKNFQKNSVTGSTDIDISAYARKFIIDQIIVTKLSGTPTTIKAGWAAGGDEVCFLTDVDNLITGIPKSISVKVVPPPTGNVVYFTIPGAVYTIDLILIRYKI